MKPLPYLKSLTTGSLLASVWILSSCATNAPNSGMTREAASANYNAPAASQPGLGTGMGMEVSSNIGYTDFKRGSSKPTSITSIYYNDKEGIAAMTNSWRYTGSGMQRAASGMVEWGVKGGWGMLKNYNSGGRRYIEGRKGRHYSLVVKNICHARLEVILSVDGLDVMDGRAASFSKRGYIIQPGKTLTVKGFRTSESAVASFKFSSVADSYSNMRHGTTRNVGVIGMAVFTEKGTDPWRWSRRAIRQRHSASPFAEAPRTDSR